MKFWRSGNVLFLILLAVALFAALGYAVTQAGRSGGKDISDEKADLDQAELENYQAAIAAGRMRLEIVNGCDSIDYTPPADWIAGDKSCHMFHPSGAGVSFTDFGDGLCPDGTAWTNLSIGDACGEIIFAGISGGNRIYAAPADQGLFNWKTSQTTTNGTDSLSDGAANTDAMEASGLAAHPAAQACRSLGVGWYLPARYELNLLWENLVDQNGDNTPGGSLGSTYGFATSGWPADAYWSSSEIGSTDGWFQRFNNGAESDRVKDYALSVRCIRQD